MIRILDSYPGPVSLLRIRVPMQDSHHECVCQIRTTEYEFRRRVLDTYPMRLAGFAGAFLVPVEGIVGRPA